MMASSSRNVKPQVFINFRGADLRRNFAPYLHDVLHRNGINAFIDNDLQVGENLTNLFEKIEESTVAVAILSSKYTESDWCLKELVKIKECVDRRTLWVIPVFYKLKTSTVKDLEGSFGFQLWELWRKENHCNRDDRILKWDAALQDVSGRKALRFLEDSVEATFVDTIAIHIQNFLSKDKQLREENLKPQGKGGENLKHEEGSNMASSSIKPGEQCLKQLEEKLDVDCNDDKTRLLGVVGMA
ncbi:unnamed protein product [Brassica oleracea var. botrytis]|uniref:BnaC09g20630D protein n=3 Tax=Brassica TaxID=3705 RepID=A0A078IF56_BRANA|nr:protein PHLOEM PROTEIN 2-LIKE A8 [Brassica napus]KAH0869154.1 hypothetical protein HID58_076176 [Brassica napus]CAF1991299.1 unnamed protein product [Brassica napus]CDY48622.1 BnaC09g20630D [Brassica napus]VDD37806.1 unnamed protein product [Brassica oleracea]